MIEAPTFAIAVTFTCQSAAHTSQATNTEQGKDLAKVVSATQSAITAWAAKQGGGS